MRVLLIENDNDAGKTITEILKLRRVSDEITQTGGCASGFAALEKDQYDLTLLDLGQDANQLECIRRIRKDFPAMPIIIVVAGCSEEVKQEAIRAGADDYVIKTAITLLLPYAVWSACERRKNALSVKSQVERCREQLQCISRGEQFTDVKHERTNV